MRDRRGIQAVALITLGIAAAYLILSHSNRAQLFLLRGTENEPESYYNKQNWQDISPNSSAQQMRIFYNRVPKCGSRTTVALINLMAKKHGFRVTNKMKEMKSRGLHDKQQVDYVRLLEELDSPVVYYSHQYYVDFSRSSSVKPIYINVIRDPVERFVSEYYFNRFRDGRYDNRNFGGTEKDRYKTFDSCVLNNKMECVNGSYMFKLISYFCGEDDMCRQPSQWSLEKAKSNVVNNYLVVGMLSEYEDFLAVLEKLLPDFFTGVLEAYRNPGNRLQERMSSTHTVHKKVASQEAKDVMRQRLALEYELYDFIKDRFQKLKHDLNL